MATCRDLRNPSQITVTDIESLKLVVPVMGSPMKGFQVGVCACLFVRLYLAPRPRPEPNLGPIRGELQAWPVMNIYMVLASYVRLCECLACVACTSESATAAACALCSEVLLGRDLAAYDAN